MARSGESFVLIAEKPPRDEETQFVAWWSSDGYHWRLAQQFPENERIVALAAGGPGFVATARNDEGASVWTSIDGRSWQSVHDESLRQGVINQLVPTASGLVGFGWDYDTGDPGIWTSRDGIEWLAATNETGRIVANGLQAVGAYDGRAIAIVDQDDDRGGLGVFETTGRAEWSEIGRFPTASLNVHKIVGGPRGWVAFGDDSLAWASPDGRRWTDADWGPDVAADVIADQSGFIAVGWVGSLPGETCGDQRPFAGQTWTSSDGMTWQRMPGGDDFSSAAVTKLFISDRTLVGFGFRIGNWPDEPMRVGRWTAQLPDVSMPADGPDKPTKPKFCGG